MVEDHDGPDITEVEEETPPPPKLSWRKNSKRWKKRNGEKFEIRIYNSIEIRIDETDETVNVQR